MVKVELGRLQYYAKNSFFSYIVHVTLLTLSCTHLIHRYWFSKDICWVLSPQSLDHPPNECVEWLHLQLLDALQHLEVFSLQLLPLPDQLDEHPSSFQIVAKVLPVCQLLG